MADFGTSLSQIDLSSPDKMPVIKNRLLRIVGTVLLIGTVLPTLLVAQTELGPYARVAICIPVMGTLLRRDTVDAAEGKLRATDLNIRLLKTHWLEHGQVAVSSMTGERNGN